MANLFCFSEIPDFSYHIKRGPTEWFVDQENLALCVDVGGIVHEGIGVVINSNPIANLGYCKGL